MNNPYAGPHTNQDWKTFRNRRGTPRWYQRFYEAWLIVIGSQSLHRAWQNGCNYGSRIEYRRLITNRAYLAEIAAIMTRS